MLTPKRFELEYLPRAAHGTGPGRARYSVRSSFHKTFTDFDECPDS